MHHIGKSLILIGILLIVTGVFFTLGGKISWFGKLPGDIIIHRKNFSFYFPATTSVLISVILSLIIFLFFRHK
jgi:hypothetical protein